MARLLLLFWLVLLSGVAWFWPAWFGTSSDPFAWTYRMGLLKPLFGGAMFCIGALLPRDEVAQVLRRWPTVLGGTAIQYAVMPLLAWSLAHGLGFEGPLFVGLVVVGCVPGAMASNVLTLAARGNASYSVSLTTSATLLSPLVVPFTMWLTLGREYDVQPLDTFLDLLLTVVGPVVAGHLWSRQQGSFAALMARIGPAVANVVILWIIAIVVALNRERLAETTALLLLALLLLNLLGYAAGYLGGTAMRLPESMRRALTLEVGMQNAGLGTVLVLELFGRAAAIPTAAYTFGCMLTGTVLAAVWGRRTADADEALAPSAADA